jgi:flagellar hook assembly protein FlgD
LNTPASVTLDIYNSLGQRIRTVVDVRKQEAGLHQIQWDATDDSNRRVASGLYIYKLQVDKQVQTKKMLLMK